MRIKFPESRRNWHDIYRDPMEERLFCFNNGPSGGDEPDGVTFTSGDDYTPGDGIQISSSTLAPNSTEDTYQGRNTSAAALNPFGGAGGNVDDIRAGRTNARGESLFTSGVTGDAEFTGVPSVAAPAAAGALASLDDSFNLSPPASPSQNLTAEQKAIVASARSRGEAPPDFSRPMTVAEIAAADRPRAEQANLFAQTESEIEAGQQRERDRAAAINAVFNNLGIARAQGATAQDVLGSGISALTGPTSRPQMQGPPRMPDQVYDFDTTPASTPEYYGEDTLEADIFGRAGGPTGRGGDLQGFDKTGYEGRSDQPRDPNVSSMGAFADSATRGGVLGTISDYGVLPNLVSRLTGQTPMDMRRENVMEFFDSGAQFNPDSGKMEVPAGKGMLKMSDSGMVTYSGPPDPSYTGMYSNLVNPSMGGGGGGGGAPKSPTDPCPPGYKMVDGACQPTGEEEGGGFQTGSGVGDTRFSPFYTPVEVGEINPFILRPYK